MNNKGFAISSIIYGLMLLFVMVVASFLSVLVGRNRRMDDLLEGVRDSLDYPVIYVYYNDDTSLDHYFYTDNTYSDVAKAYSSPDVYVTEKKGKYIFNFKNNSSYSCVAYLPKNVVIISNYLKNDTIGTDLFYSTGGEDSGNLGNYELLACIN